jgi:very-short-patch-repair endonuclease
MPKIVKIPHPKKVQPIVETKAELKQKMQKVSEQKYKDKKQFAENLANNPTASEVLMCGLLDRLNIRYQFQKVVGGYIPDFVLEGKKILELDGKYHKKQQAYDSHRDKVLRKMGYKVLRITSGRMFWDADRVTDLVTSYAFGKRKSDISKPTRNKKNHKQYKELRRELENQTDELTESFLFYTEGL